MKPQIIQVLGKELLYYGANPKPNKYGIQWQVTTKEGLGIYRKDLNDVFGKANKKDVVKSVENYVTNMQSRLDKFLTLD